MKNVLIFCQRFYDKKSRSISIGGIQTYIANLCVVLKERDCLPIVFQYSDVEAEYKTEYCTVHEVNVSKKKHLRHKNRELFRSAICSHQFDTKRDIVIFATEGLSQKKCPFYSIAIQHGISWDIQIKTKNRLKDFFYPLNQLLLSHLEIKHVGYVNKVVCVDYNYLNWYRTQTNNSAKTFQVIPNFSAVPSKIVKNNERVSVLFARRLQPYRGTRLFASAIKRILSVREDVDVIIAGDGPDEEWMKNELSDNKKITFTTYNSDQSLEIHKRIDIAVVPTIGSEGTSLSLLEALASNCAVVCTNVGGMTNIIIDGFNGLIVNPEENALFEAILYLIENPNKRIELANNGYNTVSQAFSFEVWKKKWNKILDEAFEETK